MQSIAYTIAVPTTTTEQLDNSTEEDVDITTEAVIKINSEKVEKSSSELIDEGSSSTSAEAQTTTEDAPQPTSTEEEEINSETEAIDSSEENIVSSDVNKFICAKVGRFVYPNSCDKYYYCWDTKSNTNAVFSCPEVFDPQTKRCSNDYTLCKIAPKCEFEGQILPVPNDTHSFFECKSNSGEESNEYVAVKQNCAKGREYAPYFGYCKLTSDDESSVLDSDSSESLDGKPCEIPGVSIDFTKDSRYYECIVKNVAKGILELIRRQCPKYHVFSMDDEYCIPLE